jgi:MFS family permease
MAVVWPAAGWGVAIAAFGLAPNLGLAILLLALAGGTDMISGIFRGTIWNTTIPDHLRGRLAGIEQVSYSAGPLLGNLEAGVVASFAGVRASIVSGGVLLRRRGRLGGAPAARLPTVRRPRAARYRAGGTRPSMRLR